MTQYKPRNILFEELFECGSWKIKRYSILFNAEPIDIKVINTVKANLKTWLQNSNNYFLNTYMVATLIIHKWVGGYFAIISWWTDENMLQLFVYLASKNNPTDFKMFSDKGIVSCVWEMEILWFERNAWILEVLSKKITKNNINHYLQQTFNKIV